MLFARIVAASRSVGETRSRLQKVEHLAQCLAALEPVELRAGAAFLAGELRQGKIGLGYAAVREATADTTAEHATWTILEVDRVFDEIRECSGAGSKAKRLALLSRLLSKATPDERDYLRRLVIGELRQGALEGILADAIAKAAGLSTSDVRRAAMLSGDLIEVAVVALTDGAPGIARFRLEMFRPIQPMLAQVATGIDAAFATLGDAAVEWKIDGARIQVHRQGDEVRVFTRKLNDVTNALPEVVECVRNMPVDAIVLDGEAIVLREDGRPVPFQTTMRRFGRKLDVEVLRDKLPITPFFFDCLHADGDDLIDLAGGERGAALRRIVPAENVVPQIVTGDAEAADAFFDEAIQRGHEGVMAKSLDANYEAGRRGKGWLKVKPAHTLDLIVLAAEWGSGRREGWLSNLHLGARRAETGEFVMLGKTFKGMTDEVLRWQTERLQAIATHRDDWTVFVRPELIVEIAFDGVQESPHYPGGVALRFARLKRYRTDKRPDEVDTIDRVLAIHRGA